MPATRPPDQLQTGPEPAVSRLIRNYAGMPGVRDELRGPDGALPHWNPILSELARLGPRDLAERREEVQRLLRNDGITYNVYGSDGSDGTERSWPLDLMPQVFPAKEWAAIEEAVAQRAKVFDLILRDFYGDQALLRERGLPPDLLYAHPGFLRACHGFAPPSGVHLHVYAADLARSADGRWWVISDRAQAPSGAGYALENRIVLRRAFADVFGRLPIRRLARFFQTFREALQSHAPPNRENPRIVLLTPGPYNETYFEHAYLSQYLGYTLVEGGDLTVRDNAVFLKTLGGLLRVDVILRRQDDAYCDPLELRGDSMLGVPGLVEAVRAGNVTVANALGSGVLETPAAMAFLDSLAQTLIGEPLKAPSVATWWCGQPEPFRYVLDNLDQIVIKSAFPRLSKDPVFPRALSRADRERLVRRMKAAPHKYVAQERIKLSTTPVLDGSRLVPRRLVVRVFAVANGDSYTVMPGGLARFTPSTDTFDVSMQGGGGSKDVWVLGGEGSEDADSNLTLLPARARPVDISRATFDLPSRVAENLFWLGRYAERVDVGLRLARTILPMLSAESQAHNASALEAAERLLQEMGYMRKHEEEEADITRRLEDEVSAMIFDRDRRGAFGWGVGQLRRLAWLLRDRISPDAWRILNGIDQDFSGPQPKQPLRVNAALDLLDRSVNSLSGFSGLVMESMTRGQGWRLLDIGRRLERAIQIVELLRHGLVGAGDSDHPRIEMLLQVADSTITYRSRYLTQLQADLTLDLLLIDEDNPRSVAFQLAAVQDHLHRLPQRTTSARRSPESKAVLRGLTALRVAELDRLAAAEGDKRPQLAALLSQLTAELPRISDALTEDYLSHAVRSRQLSRHA